MTKEDIEKAAKAEVENIVFYNICSEEIDNEESNYEAGRRDGVCDFGEELFIAGANWRINSVWHNVSKKPSFSNLPILLQHKNGQIHFIDAVPASWIYIQKYYTRWTYINDLMPNMKE